jgi:N-methyl-L-tryptophan oxidase
MLQSAAMQMFDVVIVGAGVMGAAAAYELAGRGAKIALIDQSALPNPRAASVDHSKVFRFAYPDAFYVKLAVDALARWRRLEEETGAKLLTQTGVVLIGKRRPSFETECCHALRSLGLEAEMLDSQTVAARFPQFNADAFSFGVLDPSGAILHAETALRRLIDLATQRSVKVFERERVLTIKKAAASQVLFITGSGQQFQCERAMIATGPWSRKLLPVVADKLTTTRQELVYFEPTQRSRFEPGSFPIFMELESGFYGFPIHHAGAMKIANHHKGVQVDASLREDTVGENFIKSCRAFFAEFIPGLADAHVRETRVCIYNNTPEDDFIIDWIPELENVLIVTGFSGHGFKFAPTIGRIAADLLVSGNTSYNIERFSLARFSE